MKKLLIASAAALALSASSALAADLGVPYYKAPPPPIPMWSWTGLYVGIDGGGGWGHESWLDNSTVGCPPCSAVTHRPDGGIFGGLVGGRYEFNNHVVIGIEGTWAGADLNDTVSTATPAIFPTETETFRVRSLYTATGQVGYAWNRALLYVKGGVAGADTRWNVNAPTALAGTPFTASNSQGNSGWTMGVGLDYALWNNVAVGVEYDHFDLGYAGFSAPVSNGGTPFLISNTSRLTMDQVVARLSYKFNFGGPMGGAPY